MGNGMELRMVCSVWLLIVIFTCSIRLIDHRLHNSSSRIDEPAKGKEKKILVFDSRFSFSVSNLIKLVKPSSCCIIYNYFI